MKVFNRTVRPKALITANFDHNIPTLRSMQGYVAAGPVSFQSTLPGVTQTSVQCLSVCKVA